MDSAMIMEKKAEYDRKWHKYDTYIGVVFAGKHVEYRYKDTEKAKAHIEEGTPWKIAFSASKDDEWIDYTLVYYGGKFL